MFRHRGKVKENSADEVQAVYTCTRCGLTLFDAAKKFSVGSGFPSFWAHMENNVEQNLLTTYGKERIQLLCQACGQHLGHLFEDNRTPSQVRYCVNAAAIEYKKL